QRCLTWAKDKKDWTVAQWAKVVFSDERKFSISFGSQGPKVWNKREEAQNPSCLRSMHFMIPSADQLYGDADFIFQQDLAPAHTAESTNTWFKNHSIHVLDLPANLP
ncbi:hypothetical protein C0J45_24238, partial [Silurus meridionalis]